MDIVFTSHALEPNGGKERIMLEELRRVARRYVVLLEPAYDLAGAKARQRMEEHGYCRRIRATCDELGYHVVRHELFAVEGNPLNPAALTIIAKAEPGPRPDYILACPRCRSRLERRGDWFYSPESLAAYPVLGGFPCLRVENGIVASRFDELDLPAEEG
jgi:uncharacterized protein YbaR (Trm112 family)